MFPAELITLIGSTFIGGLLKLWGMKQQASRAQNEAMIKALSAEREGFKTARQYENKGFQFTRRIIALTATFAIIVWPKIAAVFFPDIPITIGWTEIQPGFLFFTDDRESIIWHTVKGGLVLTPLDTHFMASIAGLYFGGSIVGAKS